MQPDQQIQILGTIYELDIDTEQMIDLFMGPTIN